MRHGKWFHGFGQDRVVAAGLLMCTVVSALVLPVNPWPRDGWFESQYHLFGRFPGEDNYTPIAAPAVLYKIVHWLALLPGLSLKGELYLASLAQNCLLFLSGCFVYYTCKYVSPGKVAGSVAISFLLFVLSTGLAQAFWSENVALVMFSAVLYLNATIYYEAADSHCSFWRRAFLSSLLTGLLVITRVTPVLLIPAIFFLLYGRLSYKRLFGYTALACLTTGLLVVAMLASNYARFGRAELTNSSGRHLWQGVTPIVDTALAESPEFLELKALDPEIEGKDWWSIRLPSDRRQELHGEELLGRLSRQAIHNEPLLFLRLGLTNFVTTIGQPIYRLGFGERDGHSDPLKTDRPLPPLGASVLNLSTITVDTAGRAIARVFFLSLLVYPIVIFFVLATYSALVILKARLFLIRHQRRDHSDNLMKYARALQLLVGALLIGVILASNIDVGDGRQIYVSTGLCVIVLLLQVTFMRGDSKARVREQAAGPPGDGVSYTILALMFFGSLWLSWQVEAINTRNVLPYLPFLSLMLAIALTYWFVNRRRELTRNSGFCAPRYNDLRRRSASNQRAG